MQPIIKETTKTTEAVLSRHFNDMRVLNIWRANAKRLREQHQRLEGKISSGIPVIFTDETKSVRMHAALPANSQPHTGLEAVIERAIKEETKLVQEHASIGIDIIVIENNIDKLERTTLTITDILSHMDGESLQVLQLKLDHKKSYDEIGERLSKSKSAAYRMYGEAIKTAHNWLKAMSLQTWNESETK